jgi:hypothetical protein
VPTVHGLRDLVRIVGRRDPGTEVQELADPSRTGQVPHNAGQELPTGAYAFAQTWCRREHPFRGLAVGGKVVGAAEPVVVDPRRMRDARVDVDGGSRFRTS